MNTQLQAGKMQRSKGNTVWGFFCGVMLGAVCLAPVAGAQTTPAAVILTTTQVAAINGNAGHVAANSAGDAFYVSQTDNVAYRLKRGSATPIALVTGLSGGRSVYVDPSNNVYVPSNYSGVIVEVPYVNGTYATGSALASLAACTNATPTTPCTQFGNGGGAVGYYYQATDLGFDASGKGYIVDAYDNQGIGGPQKFNAIEVFAYNGVSYAATILVNGLPSTQNAQIAVDAAGDVYYADGANLYGVPAGGSKVTPFGIGLSKPSGVAVDQYGNLFVTDNGLNQIIEFPALNGVAQTNQQFVFDPVYSANGVAFDRLGDMFYTAFSTQTILDVARMNSFSLGSAAIGTPASAAPIPLTVSFIAPETIGTLSPPRTGSGFTYSAGTCTAGKAYTATQTCTIGVSYTPTSVGLQEGGVVVTNSAGAVIATAELSGIGLGAALTSDPGTVAAIGSGYSSPQGIAVDTAKDVFIADAGKNAVFEYAAGSIVATSLGSGLLKPTSVAVDNAGNLYIADSGNGRVVEVPNVSGTLTTSAQSVVASGLGTQLGLATDPFGNLYVADTNGNKVLQLGLINGTPSTSAQSIVKLPATSAAPVALAADSSGNLFVADTTMNTVTEVAYFGKALTGIGSSYSHPSGLAVDASGSLYVADAGNIRLIKIPFEAPIYSSNDQYSVGPPFSVATGVVIPYAVAVDSSANLYVVDNKDATVTFLNRSQGTLGLGAANVNSTTAQQNAYIANAGDQSLILGTPAYTTTANSAFTITAPSPSGCTNAETLLPGFACVLASTFKPAAVGNFIQTLAFSSNAANSANPSLTITGAGLNVAATTLALVQTAPAGTAAFGQTVSITATISSSTSGTPGGDIIFYVDGGFYTVVKVTGTSQSINITGLLGGSHIIAASYTGDNTFASSNTTLTIAVVKAGSTVTVTGSGGSQVFQNPTSAAAGTSITLTATISPNATTVPNGTVTFVAGSQTLGTAPVTTVTNAQVTTYQASISTVALPSGSDTVAANYSGDVNYAPSSGTLTVLISLQTFTLTPTAQSVTISRSATAVVPLQMISVAGFGGSRTYVSLTCSGLPANTACGFNPNGLPLQASNQLTIEQRDPLGLKVIVPATYGPTNISLSISTGTTPVIPPPVPTAALHLPGMRGRIPVNLALLALTPLTLVFRRRRMKRFARCMRLLMVALLLSAGVTTLIGCGSGLIGSTPPGTYNITVTATATDPSYPAVTLATPLAPGCTIQPASATFTTCVQTAQISLVVQ